jgi:methionyl-tRNA synthetase
MPWGVEVPGDAEHVMYVWFDALVNYISALGWPEDEKKLEKFWGTKENPNAIQIAGKDNIRQQAAMWQAMLMSAGLPNSKQIVINGFILGEGGVKMSKSLGNVVDPLKIVEEYGTYGADALRFYLARHVNSFEDSEFSMDKFKEAYNADLANGLGNLVSRIMKMAEDNLDKPVKVYNQGYRFPDYVKEKMSEFRIDLMTTYAWDKIRELDREIQEKKPWESKDKEMISNLVIRLYQIGRLIEPLMPQVSESIIIATQKNRKPKSLFVRRD